MHTNCTAAHMARISAVQLGEIGDKWVHAGTCENVDTRHFFFSFCCLMMCSRDTANIARQPSSHRRAERTISAQMQISDSEAYAEEVTPSRFIRAYHAHCKDICGFALINPPLLEIIQTLQFTLHYPPPPRLFWQLINLQYHMEEPAPVRPICCLM